VDNGEHRSAASSPALQVGFRTAGPVDNGEHRSAASSPALQVGFRTAGPVDNGEHRSATSSPALQVESRTPEPVFKVRSLRKSNIFLTFLAREAVLFLR